MYERDKGTEIFEYGGKIIKVKDWDRGDVDIDLGFGISLNNERVRIMGIDTPESRTRDKVEKKFGFASKARLKELLGKDTILKTQVGRGGEDMKGKFGRILGDFLVNGKKAGEILIKEGHAVAYHGQNKLDVQAQHMKNRARLIKEGKVK